MWSGCARRSTASTFSSTRCRPRRGGTIVAPARRWLLRAPSAVWRPSGSRVHTTPSGRSRATDRCFSGRRGESPRGTRARGRRRRDRRRRRRQSGQARPVPPRDVSLDTRPAGRIGARAAARRSHERRLRRGSRALPGRCRGHGGCPRVRVASRPVAQVFETTRRNSPSSTPSSRRCLILRRRTNRSPSKSSRVSPAARYASRARPRRARAVHSNVRSGNARSNFPKSTR